ncbi:sulfite exporter TauE/SafE family protein [Phreatobacter sp. AB_2022a]|uniref:sulfite exporter TauE/SafE family protein n=1 Tax=Phreatobacter sp. AB_2022a TaxID=3003134 RepID=UPI0022876FF8|nr:sulfite exporter TauE/SafE family protein [Phreatobacter sp. AB_2022a]MCZ0738415.1 sulfite exporter TauE/SafE family protein [Phreatobacter sp. AB_2022a]
MQLYLPIAELPVNMLLILGMGLAVGFISGMFGVGGGFLLTPLLIFIGIPPAIAVASVSGQIAASSLSGTLSYWRKNAVDAKLAGVLLGGSVIGSLGGVVAFTLLRRAGQLDLFIAVSYVTLLSGIGLLMVLESSRAIARSRSGEPPKPVPTRDRRVASSLPLMVNFPRSRITVSIIPVMAIGLGIGFLGSMMGIGGGFLLVPALIYLLRVSTSVVIGTSSLQTLITMLLTVVFHAVTNASVDVVLALLLMIGGVIGAQFGARTSLTMKGEELRLMLGLVVLAVGVRFLVDLVLRPDDPFTNTIMEWSVR